MKLEQILSKKVSFQENAWSSISRELTVNDIIEVIRSGKYSTNINFLRELLSNGNLEQYAIHKKSLPAVTFCGLFDRKRKRETLIDYTQIVVIDIDKLDRSEIIRVKSILEKDEYVFSFWESPSKLGLKGLVYLSFGFEFSVKDLDECHKSAFITLKQYFLEKYGISLDESGSDTTRLCFLSFDPQLTLKPVITAFNINEKNLVHSSKKKEIVAKIIKHTNRKNALYNPKNKNKPADRKTIQSIIRFLTKNKFSITYTYEEWYRVAFSIANTFTFDIGLKYFLNLSKLDPDKYNEINCKNMLTYCYESSSGEINFSTIIYFANKKGYKGVGSIQAA